MYKRYAELNWNRPVVVQIPPADLHNEINQSPEIRDKKLLYKH